MKKLLVILTSICSIQTFGQTLYVPSGTSGIGTSLTGYVGVGTNSPQTSFEVIGNQFIRNTSSSAYTSLRLYNNLNNSLRTLEIDYAGSQFAGSMIYGGPTGESASITTTGTYPLTLGTNNNMRITITGDGQVGIGTPTPSAKLEINQAGGVSGQNLALKIWAGNSFNYFGNSQISFSYGGGGGGYSHAIKTRHNSAAISGNAFDFYVWKPGDPVNGEGSLQVMTLNGDKVGIGTAAPQKKLHLSGTGDVEQWIEATDNGFASLTLKSNNKQWHWSKRPGTDQDALRLFYHDGAAWTLPYMSVLPNGNVGIGSSLPTSKLSVKGTIHAEEVKVDLTVPGPDYVFEKDYDLLSLTELETYITQHKHLPEVPSAKEMEANGLNLKEMNLILLKKVEELTLHLIEQSKEIHELRSEIKEIKK